jgi:serine/threonine-protein kinase
VAKALSAAGGDELTQTGMALGTPAYMSPEQASGALVDARSDIYALGCVLYEMLAGEAPYTGPTPQAILAKRVLEPVPHVRTLRENVPEAVEQAITRALAKAPADRFASAAEFARALAATGATTPSTRALAPASQTGPIEGRRRAGRWGVAILLAAISILVVGVTAWLLRSRNGPSGLDADRLAIAPFDVLDPRLQLWHEGLVDLLSRNLDGAGPLRTVPPTTVIRRWNGRADQPSAVELGRRTGARLAVVGSLVPAGTDSARLRATLYDVATGRSLADLELRDAVGRVDRLSDSLTVRLLAELGRNRRIELTRVASLGSTSLPALKAFLQGEQFFRMTAWDSATAAYERAVALDSNFTLALWRLGRVIGWQRIGFDSLSQALSLRAGALNRGLAPRDSLLVLVDSILDAEARYSWRWYKRLRAAGLEAVRRYPDDADAWHTLGEVYEHAGLLYGSTPREVLSAFDRAISLDSAYAPAYIHAIEEASRVYGLDVARRYALEYLRRAPGDVTAEGIRLAIAVADPARAHTPEVEHLLQRASANVLLKAWLPFYGATDSGEVAVRIARAMASSRDSAPWLPPTFRHDLFAFALSYRGHLNEAVTVWTPGSGWSEVLASELSLLGERPPGKVVKYFSDRLRARDLASGSGLLWWARSGDSASIMRYQRLADSVARSSSDPSLREHGLYGSAAAAGYLALVRKDTTGALRRFEHLPDSLCSNCESLTLISLWSSRREDRKVLEANGWSFLPTASEVVARLEQARAADRLGEHERAIRDYQFVVDAWRHADPELQPYVAEARRALERLSGEPRPKA